MDERELGRLEAELALHIAQSKEERLEFKEELKEVKVDVKEIARILTQAQGSWKTLAILGTITATVGGLIATFIGLII